MFKKRLKKLYEAQNCSSSGATNGLSHVVNSNAGMNGDTRATTSPQDQPYSAHSSPPGMPLTMPIDLSSTPSPEPYRVPIPAPIYPPTPNGSLGFTTSSTSFRTSPTTTICNTLAMINGSQGFTTTGSSTTPSNTTSTTLALTNGSQDLTTTGYWTTPTNAISTTLALINGSQSFTSTGYAATTTNTISTTTSASSYSMINDNFANGYDEGPVDYSMKPSPVFNGNPSPVHQQTWDNGAKHQRSQYNGPDFQYSQTVVRVLPPGSAKPNGDETARPQSFHFDVHPLSTSYGMNGRSPVEDTKEHSLQPGHPYVDQQSVYLQQSLQTNALDVLAATALSKLHIPPDPSVLATTALSKLHIPDTSPQPVAPETPSITVTSRKRKARSQPATATKSQKTAPTATAPPPPEPVPSTSKRPSPAQSPSTLAKDFPFGGIGARKVVTTHQDLVRDLKEGKKKVKGSAAALKGGYSPSYLEKGDVCKVCGDPATGYHYHIFTCEGCKGFFRRSVQKKNKYECVSKVKGSCLQRGINRANRTKCQFCRLQKCLQAGMKKDLVHCEEKRKKNNEVKKRNREKRIKALAEARRAEARIVGTAWDRCIRIIAEKTLDLLLKDMTKEYNIGSTNEAPMVTAEEVMRDYHNAWDYLLPDLGLVLKFCTSFHISFFDEENFESIRETEPEHHSALTLPGASARDDALQLQLSSRIVTVLFVHLCRSYRSEDESLCIRGTRLPAKEVENFGEDDKSVLNCFFSSAKRMKVHMMEKEQYALMMTEMYAHCEFDSLQKMNVAMRSLLDDVAVSCNRQHPRLRNVPLNEWIEYNTTLPQNCKEALCELKVNLPNGQYEPLRHVLANYVKDQAPAPADSTDGPSQEVQDPAPQLPVDWDVVTDSTTWHSSPLARPPLINGGNRPSEVVVTGHLGPVAGTLPESHGARPPLINSGNRPSEVVVTGHLGPVAGTLPESHGARPPLINSGNRPSEVVVTGHLGPVAGTLPESHGARPPLINGGNPPSEVVVPGLLGPVAGTLPESHGARPPLTNGGNPPSEVVVPGLLGPVAGTLPESHGARPPLTNGGNPPSEVFVADLLGPVTGTPPESVDDSPV